ncbi:hypothetical protein ABZX77_49165 [Streptomyces sp. NPDC004237]|uniref:hypothetical protein n=1 Tax=Streptomyces sp. NPDC004237 TaxID=3154455 RepID=UPI0033ADD981
MASGPVDHRHRLGHRRVDGFVASPARRGIAARSVLALVGNRDVPVGELPFDPELVIRASSTPGCAFTGNTVRRPAKADVSPYTSPLFA